MTIEIASDPRTPSRTEGFAPLRDYAVIGNKRTAALVALDGSIDWLSLPTLGSPSAFGALLDAERGGRFALAPAIPFRAQRCYLPDTNVLETTFITDSGAVRVTDCMSRPLARSLLWNQVIRRVDGLAGEVPMRWAVEPRFDYAAARARPSRIAGTPAFVYRDQVLAVECFEAGDPRLGDDVIRGEFDAVEGATAVLALSAFEREPVTLGRRDPLLRRLDDTAERWRRWLAGCGYDGPWGDAVRRSALALDLLVDDESGAIAAAATMGLPERIGGGRNYDYRYAWLRDANLTLEAMLRLAYGDQVHLSLGWILRTISRTRPRLRPMYQLDGEPRLPDRSLALAGYRGSRPVLLGNGAQDQLQLGNYGDVFDMAHHYVADGNALAPGEQRALAEAADFLARIWRRPDASIWELSDQSQYTQSKLACWIALDRAADLASRGALPSETAATWRKEADAVAAFVADRCWSSAESAYAREAGSDELDAAVLLAGRGALMREQPGRFEATIDAVRRRLGAGGPLLYRYSGMQREEGAFVACSFWLADALARLGRVAEASKVMDEMVDLANDVGLYSEEIDPVSGDFLGNLPQALSHLALVNAAYAIADAGG